MPIHPTAIIDPLAEIDPSATIGPYAIISGKVVLGPRCRVGAHAQLYGILEIGEETRVGPAAVIGTPPQSSGFDPDTPSGVRIGCRNRIREHVTIHRSASESGTTVVGDGNYLMVGAHLGHDVVMGDRNIVANGCLLGGHVSVGNDAFLGGGAVFHQFVRIGDRAMIQGKAGFSMDVPPYVIGAEINRVAGINSVGLRRAGFSGESRREIKSLYALFYRQRKAWNEALREAREKTWGREAEVFLDFVESPGRKGICRRVALKD